MQAGPYKVGSNVLPWYDMECYSSDGHMSSGVMSQPIPTAASDDCGPGRHGCMPAKTKLQKTLYTLKGTHGLYLELPYFYGA